jgi:hypothetical protein
MPRDVQEFYSANEGRYPLAGKRFVEYLVYLRELGDVRVGFGSDSEFLATWLADKPRSAWLRTRFAAIGETCFGDEILFAEATPARKAGGVYIAGRDVSGPSNERKQPSTILCVAPTITEWLENLRTHNWIEYAVIPGDIKRLSVTKQKKLRAFYNHLNPGLEW